MSIVDLSKPNRDTTLLAPFVQNRLLMALNECHDFGYMVSMFEGYRSPQRSDWLYQQGRDQQGRTVKSAKIVSNAKAWQSSHNYAIALDIAFLPRPKAWHWPKSDDPIWDKVHDIFHRYDFETISWEKPHFEITAGMKWQEMKKIHDRDGLLGLWNVIEMRLKKS